jgi:hypothetical protein
MGWLNRQPTRSNFTGASTAVKSILESHRRISFTVPDQPPHQRKILTFLAVVKSQDTKKVAAVPVEKMSDNQRQRQDAQDARRCNFKAHKA